MRGGITIKSKFNAQGFDKVDLPEIINLPLINIKPLVKVGDKVLTGQMIADNKDDDFAIPIHASISGEVIAIDKTITIKSDGKDVWQKINTDNIKEILKISGIIGLGGAGFPTHIKANIKNCETLIINATECEPDVSADDTLMQRYPKEIIEGIEILQKICGAKRVIIAIENDKPKAIESLTKENKDFEINSIKVKYTSGSDKVLIKNLLNIEIPKNGYASDIGVLCQNVATIKAIYDAVILKQPLISRIVTVTGDGVEKPNNYLVRLGTPLKTIIDLSKPIKNPQLRVGGMMMGYDISSDETPIFKTTNAIFVNEIKVKEIVQPCIRCAQCNEVCPINLLPQQLFWYAKSDDFKKALDYKLMDCFECNCCTYVCPSKIELVDVFKSAKALAKEYQIQQELSLKAKERFDFKEYRIKRNATERKEMMARKKKELQQKMANDKIAQDKITAAMKTVNATKT
jgi:electron transport complex protein RnfC